MDKVAVDWAEHVIDTVRKARQYTSSFDDNKGNAEADSARRNTGNTKRKNSQTMFHGFEQKGYDFNILEQQLLRQ